MARAQSKDGIISFLSRKHGGNVHEKEIITLTSKSSPERLKRAVDFDPSPSFRSTSEPGQWICWDFQDMRVRVTDYTIKTSNLRSWVVESSEDGEHWREMDRQTDDQNFRRSNAWAKASFVVSSPTECRLVRLTQTDKGHKGSDSLELFAVEFFGTLVEPISSLPVSSASPEAPNSRRGVQCEMKKAKSLKGIISFLTKKHGGNVHEKEIVRITAKSTHSRDIAKNVADFEHGSHFSPDNEQGQWVCWDFHEMRVRPTHCTIYAYKLKSWTIESSVDGENWKEIDRRTDDANFKSWGTASFPLSSHEACRFIRLTQTDKRHDNSHSLALSDAEFFGVLFE
jgi:hypothetical protein